MGVNGLFCCFVESTYLSKESVGPSSRIQGVQTFVPK